MKRDVALLTSGLKLSAILSSGLTLAAFSTFALSETGPYSAISGRNAFGLKAPPIQTNITTTTPNPAPGIELQGFTTILGRPQVLLKIKLSPKPPEPARDQSLVMEAGQREGDIEIVTLDAYAGTVSLKNQGNLMSLNLKDNVAKPIAGPALSAPVVPPAPGAVTPPGFPTISPRPSGTIIPTGNPGGESSRPNPNLPIRTLRTTSAANSSGTAIDQPQSNSRSYQPPVSSLSLEEQMAILAVQHETSKGSPTAGLLPPLPHSRQP